MRCLTTWYGGVTGSPQMKQTCCTSAVSPTTLLVTWPCELSSIVPHPSSLIRRLSSIVYRLRPSVVLPLARYPHGSIYFCRTAGGGGNSDSVISHDWPVTSGYEYRTVGLPPRHSIFSGVISLSVGCG